MALDFFAGCIGGCAGVIVGHPLDTVKAKLQTQCSQQPHYKGTIDCLKKIISREGIRGVYRGMSSPLTGVAGINAILFGIYGNTQKLLSNPESLTSHAVAGGIAGLSQSILTGPMELAKLKLQVSNTSKSPLACLNSIYSSQGLRGIFKGLNITVMREVPACASYFWLYEYLTRGGNSTLGMLLAGGTAGTISWLVVYPIDVLKTRLQVDEVGRYSGGWDCLKKGVKAEGYGFLFRGLTPTLIRAFPVNAATFTVVTWTIRLLGEEREGELWERCTDAVYTLKVSDAVPA